MKNIKVTFIFLAMLVIAFVYSCKTSKKSSYDKEVIMKLGDHPVYLSDFEYIYHKNNGDSKDAYTEESIRDYLDLYKKFKLKVIEAKRLGLDTTKEFKKELNKYKEQLAKPYLNAKNVKDSLIRQAYERMKTEVKASHILISVGKNANPEDTLEAYQKAKKVRKLALEGKDFEKLARNFSDDPSAKKNGGNLGYFSALQMVYPFENAAYQTPEGGISKPVRTKYGYHIIKVHDKRPSRGKVKVAHIMIRGNKNMPEEDSIQAVKKINKIYKKLQNGADWNKMVKEFSEDKRSKNKGGKLPEFKTGQMVPSFENAAFKLDEPGDISKPVRTPYGWHIIKLINKKSIPPFNKIKDKIKKQVENDSRSNLSKKILIRRLKKENNFRQNDSVLTKVRNEADQNLVKGNWSYKKDSSFLDKTIFSINDKNYKVEGFFKYVNNKQRFRKNISPLRYMNILYDNYVDDKIMEYEKNHLADKYEEYRMLVKEYRDGILLFDLMDSKVWSKAVEDTAGIKKYYKNNKKDYMWGERANAIIYSAANKKIIQKARKRAQNKYYKADYINNDTILFTDELELKSHDTVALNRCFKTLERDKDILVQVAGAAEYPKEFRLVFSYLKDHLGVDSSRLLIKDEHHPGDVKHNHEYIVLHYYSSDINDLEKSLNKNKPLNVKINKGKFEKGDNKVIDSLGFEVGKYSFKRNNRNYFVNIKEILKPSPKSFNEAKGSVISDYQNYLEKQWVDSLRKKYPVKVYDDKVEKLINKKKRKPIKEDRFSE